MTRLLLAALLFVSLGASVRADVAPPPPPPPPPPKPPATPTPEPVVAGTAAAAGLALAGVWLVRRREVRPA